MDPQTTATAIPSLPSLLPELLVRLVDFVPDADACRFAGSCRALLPAADLARERRMAQLKDGRAKADRNYAWIRGELLLAERGVAAAKGAAETGGPADMSAYEAALDEQRAVLDELEAVLREMNGLAGQLVTAYRCLEVRKARRFRLG